MKTDVSTGAVIWWQEEDCSPSEPVFVGCPGAEKEDDGNYGLVS